MTRTQEIENRFTSGFYVKRDLTIVSGQGALLFDDLGNAYIDCVGGQGAANLGHANKKIAEAIYQQAQKLVSCPEIFYNDQRAALLEKLINLTNSKFNRGFLCNSGTEAVEAALKISRISTGRTEFVAAMRGFHGRTMGALSVTWEKKYRQPFEPLVPGVTHIPYNNFEKLEQVVNEHTAAVILEIVQGEGGVYPGTAEFLKGAQVLCNKFGALLIIDEIQTGFGRTGKLFAYEHFDLEPDLLCVAKSIAGGLPMGAVLIGKRVNELLPGLHGTTFGGNPVICAAANAALDIYVEDHLPERAMELGGYFIGELRKLEIPLIREVRGLGLIVGIELRQKVTPYISLLKEHGVLALPAGLTVLRFLPPLVIEKEQLDKVVTEVREVLTI